MKKKYANSTGNMGCFCDRFLTLFMQIFVEGSGAPQYNKKAGLRQHAFEEAHFMGYSIYIADHENNIRDLIKSFLQSY